MARPGRPASESYPSARSSVSDSVSYSSQAGTVEDEKDQAPIFSLSKSSMDVVMATGPPHKRDPAWTRMDIRRSSSTNTHSEQNSVTFQQLHPHMWQHISSHQIPLTTQNVDMHSPPALSERWISNMQRWSGCSGGTHSRSSTPDTIVWKGGSSRPSSLTQEALYSSAPDSPMSKLTSPATTPSPFISPLCTPTLPPVDLITSSSSPLALSTHQQEDSSPLQTPTSAPLRPNSPDLHQLTSTGDERLLENKSLLFQYPSPAPSSVSLAEAGVSSDLGCLVEDRIERLSSPRGMPVLEGEGVRSPVQISGHLMPQSPAEGQESRRGPSVCHLDLPWQPEQSSSTGQGWKSPLVSSLSDSGLGYCCRCNMNTKEGAAKAPMAEGFREGATMTSQREMVDAAVQTISPISSWWNLGRNISTSNMGSHSILGSPPGSRLNLKSSVGSNSNLVSPSSSMFPVSSGEEDERRGDDPAWDASSHELGRRRPCLKIQLEESDKLGGRRSSMKQVQWDEDGMTWDVHGASVDPEVLTSAIRKHLELHNSPRPLKRSSKKKKAPKPPVISNVVRAMAPEMSLPVRIVTSKCTEEEDSEGAPDGGGEVEQEGGGKKGETVEAPRRRSTAEGDNAKQEEEEEEVYGEEGRVKSPSHGSGHARKKSVIRSLRRPGWCGGSRKTQD